MTKANDDLKIGDRMADGTIFAGISPDTKRPIYALPEDAPLTVKWKQAIEYANNFQDLGNSKGTFRAPTKDELNILFQNRAKIGGFNEIDWDPESTYWSSTCQPNFADFAWRQSFDDEARGVYTRKGNKSSLRLIRD